MVWCGVVWWSKEKGRVGSGKVVCAGGREREGEGGEGRGGGRGGAGVGEEGRGREGRGWLFVCLVGWHFRMQLFYLFEPAILQALTGV